MSKIMFIGDTHLTGQAPSSRKETNEQYRELLISKLESCRQICLNQDIKTVIIEGDVFNNNSGIMNSFEIEIWSKFLDFKKEGIEVYSIVGNHDMIFQSEQEFKGSYIYKAFLAGIIKHLDTLQIGPIGIVGVDYNKDYKKASDIFPNNKYNICVAHAFYENERFGGTGNSNLTDEKCVDLGYNAYVLGHDHSPYDIIDIHNYKVIRTGSLTRGTSKTCNLYRKVKVSVFDISTLEWTEVEIPTKPGKEVFNEKVVLSKDLDVNLEQLLENFSASRGMNIYDIIDSHKEEGQKKLGDKYDEVIDLITQHCESVGIYRKLDENDNKE